MLWEVEAGWETVQELVGKVGGGSDGWLFHGWVDHKVFEVVLDVSFGELCKIYQYLITIFT